MLVLQLDVVKATFPSGNRRRLAPDPPFRQCFVAAFGLGLGAVFDFQPARRAGAVHTAGALGNEEERNGIAL